MRRISTAVVVGGVSLFVLSAACSKDPPPAQAPAQPVYQQPPQPGQPGYQAPPVATQPVPGQLATPGPTALPCQNDSQCVTHRCNTQYGKCAFPCVSDADCIQGTTCFVAAGPAAACMPKAPGT
jgi:hypothetical protein